MNECCICGNEQVDRCHIKSKGAGGGTDDFNLVSMCRKHHQEQHRIGVISFYHRHESYRERLKEKGWEIVEILGKEVLIHENK